MALCLSDGNGRWMMFASRIERLIPDATGLIAVIVMGCAFLLSFANLQAGAGKAGISPWLSWAWPVCVDALLIAGSLMILRSSLRKESTWFGWLVVFGFTGVSVGFNVVHSSGDFSSYRDICYLFFSYRGSLWLMWFYQFMIFLLELQDNIYQKYKLKITTQ